MRRTLQNSKRYEYASEAGKIITLYIACRGVGCINKVGINGKPNHEHHAICDVCGLNQSVVLPVMIDSWR
jgi:hypothetical protein